VVDDVPQGILVFRENDVVLPIQVRNAIDKLAAKVSERYEASGAPESK
jgi:predicted ribonuclease YlaK